MNWNIFKRKPKAERKKKSKTREWVDAIVFAVIAATIIRGLLFSAYAIPSGSMEGTQLVGDYLFVSKISYGPRIANTPLAIPFTEPKVFGIKTYLSFLQLPYWRLPGLGEIKKGDIVVFNTPEEADLEHSTPVDERTSLIKRCQATPGDTLTIVNTQVYINGKAAPNAPHQQTSYLVTTTDATPINPKILTDLNIEKRMQRDTNVYELVIPRENIATLKSYSNIKSIVTIIKKAGEIDSSSLVFPRDLNLKWNEDNYGPLIIPKRGWTISVNDSTMTLYRRAIEVYENNKIDVNGKDYYINGKKADTYTFKMNYYWMMGDNRHDSWDSRFWGYVPEDHIVGKAVMTFFSTDSTKSFFNKIRWHRIFKPID
ncbi:signal peptidase I [Mucilaginibacter sp.]|jgi:signal peptidase I|uniref:signal peptidase I n=1 Tax=Mucilaginibacter sp. TaxID=1882438 RepID=UPI002B7D6992|nr:signal peptidase I [Mucilaginibacter sp.]HTI60546.1 signal peptidase I [Mucilaginibacter sp.]